MHHWSKVVLLAATAALAGSVAQASETKPAGRTGAVSPSAAVFSTPARETGTPASRIEGPLLAFFDSGCFDDKAEDAMEKQRDQQEDQQELADHKARRKACIDQKNAARAACNSKPSKQKQSCLDAAQKQFNDCKAAGRAADKQEDQQEASADAAEDARERMSKKCPPPHKHHHHSDDWDWSDNSWGN